ncbi:MAG: VCBS repeat-containing protein [Microcoleus sp. SU_5_3]|nr:VCBS repeat-containing protein [Microcoleus sp. SU_5_3]
MVVTNLYSNTVSILLNTTTAGATTPTFATRVPFATGSGPISVSIGDINADGKPDLAVANLFNSNASILLNTTATGQPLPLSPPKLPSLLALAPAPSATPTSTATANLT